MYVKIVANYAGSPRELLILPHVKGGCIMRELWEWEFTYYYYTTTATATTAATTINNYKTYKNNNNKTAQEYLPCSICNVSFFF